MNNNTDTNDTAAEDWEAQQYDTWREGTITRGLVAQLKVLLDVERLGIQRGEAWNPVLDSRIQRLCDELADKVDLEPILFPEDVA